MRNRQLWVTAVLTGVCSLAGFSFAVGGAADRGASQVSLADRTDSAERRLPAEGVRNQSRTAFQSLGPRQARELALEKFASLRRRGQGAPELSRGAKIVGFANDRTAQIRSGKRTGLLMSTLPLRHEQGGRKVPVEIGLERRGGGWAPRSPMVPTTFGNRISDGFSLNELVTVIPDTAPGRSGASAQRLGRDRLFFAAIARDSDFIAESTALGFENYWQLRSAGSPTRLALDHRLAEGVSLEQRGQAIHIVRNGTRVGRILPPSAIDAAGRAVPVTQILRGTRLEVQVDHRRRDVTHPVLVDPGYIREDWLTQPTWREGNPVGLENWTATTTHSRILTGVTCDVLSLIDCDDTNRLGLFIRAQTGYYQDASRGMWEYRVPGSGPPNSWVQRMTVSSLRSSSNGGPATFTAAIYLRNASVGSVAQANLPANYGPSGQLTVSDPNAPETNDVTRAHFAGAMLWMNGDGSRSTWNTVSVGGAYVESYEKSYPALGTRRLDWSTSAWQLGEGVVTGEFEMGNLGFGIASNNWAAYAPGEFEKGAQGRRDQSTRVSNVACDGKVINCSTYFTTPFSLNASAMPEGVNKIHLGGSSPSGQGSDGASNAFDYKIDRSPPRKLQLSGSLWDNRNTVLAPGSYSLSAEAEDWGRNSGNTADAPCSDTGPWAKRSGVRQIVYEVNGVQEAASPLQAAEKCSYTWSPPSFNTAGREPGVYAIRVTVTDGVGLVKTEVLTVIVGTGSPVNSSPPTITGTARQGATLSASPGSWAGESPTTSTYQWQRCDRDGGACIDIRQASSSSYVPDGSDIGARVRVVVTQRNDRGSASAVSAPTAEIAPDRQLPAPGPGLSEPELTPDPAYSPTDTPCVADSTVPGGSDCSDDGADGAYASAAAEPTMSTTGLQHRGYGVSDDSDTPDTELIFGGPYATKLPGCPVAAYPSDSPKNQSDQDFRDLRLQKARLIVPWDIMRGKSCAEPRSEYRDRYRDVMDWLLAARANGKQVLVSFEHAILPYDGAPREPAPSLADYEAKVLEFRREFPWVKDFTAWNEPNGSRQPTEQNPRLAARYWIALRGVCKQKVDEGDGDPDNNTCRAIAGDFLDTHFWQSCNAAGDNPECNKRFEDWFNEYKEGLGGRNPGIWAIHAYRTGRLGGEDPDGYDAKSLREFLRWTAGLKIRCNDDPSGFCRPRVWLTEQGGIVYRGDADGTPRDFGKRPGEEGYADALAAADDMLDFLLNRLPGKLGTFTNMVTRFYVYEWQGSPTHDSGLTEIGRPQQNREMYTTYRTKVTLAPGYAEAPQIP